MHSRPIGYTPYMGICLAAKNLYGHAKLWITREKLWITVLNWGQLVQFGIPGVPGFPHIWGVVNRDPPGVKFMSGMGKTGVSLPASFPIGLGIIFGWISPRYEGCHPTQPTGTNESLDGSISPHIHTPYYILRYNY